MTTTTPRTRPSVDRSGRRALGRGVPDAGSASVEVAILFPVLLMVILAVVQYGLWFHARSLALAAAQEGVTAARTYTADPAAGSASAREFIETNGSGTLTDVAIVATAPTVGQVGVQVTGRSLSLLPGVAGISVTQSAEGPVERFTTAGDP